MKDQELCKVIPFVIWTSEFDFYRRDAYILAKRGKKLGVMLDIKDTPGVPHGFHLKDFDSSETKCFIIKKE